MLRSSQICRMLSNAQRAYTIQNPIFTDIIQKGDSAMSQGDFLREAIYHRYIQENIRKRPVDTESLIAFTWNCHIIHRFPVITEFRTEYQIISLQKKRCELVSISPQERTIQRSDLSLPLTMDYDEIRHNFFHNKKIIVQVQNIYMKERILAVGYKLM